MRQQLTQLMQFLTQDKWCKGSWYRDRDGVPTLNNAAAKKFDLIGAINTVFSGKQARDLKLFLEGFLAKNHTTYLSHLFSEAQLNKLPIRRTDYSNLAQFNDELSFFKLNKFLHDAALVA